MDRNRMRAIIFSDPAAKGRLERIIHPIVGREVQAGIALAEGANSPLIVIEIPLLVESGRWRALLHRILVVDCSIDEQVKRVVQRSGLDETEVTRIITAQAGRDARLAAADVVIFNQHLSLGELHDHVDQIGSQLGIRSLA
jgi:dephospho-CoA kinase